MNYLIPSAAAVLFALFAASANARTPYQACLKDHRSMKVDAEVGMTMPIAKFIVSGKLDVRSLVVGPEQPQSPCRCLLSGRLPMV
ncbi:MAG: hypothetical protein KF892_24900 [Rhizobacter sp.]|nr:hypothetical protein [Rhizobacter sp.]